MTQQHADVSDLKFHKLNWIKAARSHSRHRKSMENIVSLKAQPDYEMHVSDTNQY